MLSFEYEGLRVPGQKKPALTVPGGTPPPAALLGQGLLWGAGQDHTSHFKNQEKEEFCQQCSGEWNRPEE